jgi:ABC-type polysaccharide/polyol phosphate transport system ATPase subunit
MHPRLTMHQNIFLVGSLFGLSQKEIHHLFPAIVTFSGLKTFVNTKLYQFSEGMKQRLAFSIAAHTRLDILLLDEVFEVGDESFCKKSAAMIQSIVADGGTALLVSHDLDIIERYATRVIWLDKGRIHKTGPAAELINDYATLEKEA